MKVVSLFDGISVARLALNRLNVKDLKYYASEINKDALTVSQDNWNDIVHLGDVRKISGDEAFLKNPDLLIFGAPCQDLSIAMRNRQGLDGNKSCLFFEGLRILRKIKPKYFLVENVATMKDEDRDIITKELGVNPIMINSSLVSAQLRRRYYWTNIPNITQPIDKQIKLNNIITSGFVDREKSRCISARGEGIGLVDKTKIFKRYKTTGMITIVFEKPDFAIESVRVFNQTELERLQTLPDGYTKSLTRNKACEVIGNAFTADVIVHILQNIVAPIPQPIEIMEIIKN